MPVRVSWDAEVPHTIFYQYDTYWTWEEYFQGLTTEIALAREIPAIPYDTISNFLQCRMVPRGPVFSHAQYSAQASPSNFRFAYMVMTNPFFKSLISTYKTLVPAARELMIVTSSLEEARQLVRENQSKASEPVR